MNKISSRQNPKFKIWKSLLDSRGIKKNGLFLIAGSRLVTDSIRDGLEIQSLLLADGMGAGSLVQPEKVVHLPKDMFVELDVFGTQTPILVARAPQVSFDPLEQKPQGLQIFTATGDPSNLGALIRSAEAFSAEKVVLLKEGAHPFHPKAVRTSSGSCWRIKLELGPSIHDLPSDIVALDMKGADIYAYEWPQGVRLLVGEEGLGIPESYRGPRLSIPMAGKIESLNATAAASIAMALYQKQVRPPN